MIKAAGSVPAVEQAGGNFERVVDAGRIIGTDRNTGQPTSVYTVITDAARNLITAFPGRPGGVRMGLNIVLVSYRGEALESIGDPKNFLHRALPPADEDSKSLLAKIDWYGDTFFNYLQMKRFLAEWEQVAAHARTREEQDLVAGVRLLAVRCQKDRGILRIIGD